MLLVSKFDKGDAIATGIIAGTTGGELAYMHHKKMRQRDQFARMMGAKTYKEAEQKNIDIGIARAHNNAMRSVESRRRNAAKRKLEQPMTTSAVEKGAGIDYVRSALIGAAQKPLAIGSVVSAPKELLPMGHKVAFVGGATGSSLAALQTSKVIGRKQGRDRQRKYDEAREARKVNKRLSSRYGGTPGHGYRSFEPEEIAKVGDWKVIEQREQQMRRNRKTRDVGLAVAAGGVGAAGGIYQEYPHSARDAARIVKPNEFERLVHPGMMSRVKAYPAGAALGGSLGVAGVGLGVAAGAQGMKSWHQHKINQRRRMHHGRRKELAAKSYYDEIEKFTATSVLARAKPIAQMVREGGQDLGRGFQAANAGFSPKGVEGAAGKTGALAGKLTSMARAKPVPTAAIAGAMGGGALASMGKQKPVQPTQGMGTMGSFGKANYNTMDRHSQGEPEPLFPRRSKRQHDPEGRRQYRLGAYTAGAATAGGGYTVSGARELHRINSKARTAGKGGRSASQKASHVRLVNRSAATKLGVGGAGLAGAAALANYSRSGRNRRYL
jgi:hypothetical protein